MKPTEKFKKLWEHNSSDIIQGLTISALLWVYIINSWACYFGSSCRIPWYMGMIVGSYWRLRGSAFSVAIFTYITMIILGAA